jgi:hypothetical protein
MVISKLTASVMLAFHFASPFHTSTTCERTYTMEMASRAIDATFDGGQPATAVQRARIRRYIRCQRHRSARPYLRRLWTMRARPARMNGPAVASWYYDGGTTGCGFHAALGVATLIAPCGSHIRICNGSSCIVATRDDSGPYTGGRTFDLNPTSRAALGCAPLCAVRWRLVA